MSETVLRILLSELATLRVRCLRCRSQAAVEVPLAKLDRLYADWRCPLCGESFSAAEERGRNYLVLLAEALEGIREASGRVEVEFVIPAAPLTAKE